MHGTALLRRALLFVALVAMTGTVWAGEEEKKPEPPKAAEDEGAPEDMVAKVDNVVITRADLNMARRQLALNPRAPVPNNEQLVEQLISRVLWTRYFDAQGLRASGAEVQRAIQGMDSELRQRGLTYQRWVASRGFTAEEHAGMLAYDLSMGRLLSRIQKDIPEEEIKTEFDAHPEWYDGSRIHVSQIFIETADLGNDPDKLKKAKDKVDKIHADLVAGKDFGRMARDFSEGVASAQDGDRGWFTRKGPEVDEPLIAAAWGLKVGEITKPIQGARGWHIIKLVDREPARFTYFGSKQNVMQELTRRRLTSLLDELKAKAKIVKKL